MPLWYLEHAHTPRPVQVVVGDKDFMLVSAEREALDRFLAAAPDWRLRGPAETGRYTGDHGATVYVVDGKVVDQIACIEALGFTPEDFDAESWDDVPQSEIVDTIPWW